MTTPRRKTTVTPTAPFRPLPTRFEDMTPADLDAVYLRAAGAFKRFEARQAARAAALATPTVTDTTTPGGHE